jgi:hypothetical protein
MLWITGCDKFAVTKSTILNATCYMEGFEGFPEKVTGPVTLELRSYLTILVKNKDKTEKVEITFPKSKCKAN